MPTMKIRVIAGATPAMALGENSRNRALARSTRAVASAGRYGIKRRHKAFPRHQWAKGRPG